MSGEGKGPRMLSVASSDGFGGRSVSPRHSEGRNREGVIEGVVRFVPVALKTPRSRCPKRPKKNRCESIAVVSKHACHGLDVPNK